MGKLLRAGCVGVVGLGGCASVPPVENPALILPCDVDNPMNVPTGTPTPDGYREVYDRVLNALNDYFPEVKPGSRYSGQIETQPRVAPGYEQPWKPGSPDGHERLLATYQTVRHYAVVQIWAGERGGYRVYVEVHKEVEDLNRPVLARTGAVFQEAPTVDRQFAPDAAQMTSPSWIPAGRDPAMEQVILRKIQQQYR